MHLNEGQLRAALDNELDARGQAHLVSCAACRYRADELTVRSQQVAAQVDALMPRNAHEPSANLALARFKTEPRTNRKENQMFGQIFNRRYRAAWVALAVVAFIAVAMTFPPVQAWAEGVLAQFRVKNIVVLPVDTTRLSELGGESTVARELSKLIADSMKVTKESGKPQVAANIIEAGKLAGFGVRVPANRTDVQLTVQDSFAFEFVVNRARAQSLMNEAGLGSYQLPASLDKAVIKVSIPAGVTAAYGECAKPGANDAPRLSTNCVYFTQMPSPTVDTPPNVDMAQLAEMGLQVSGMSKEQARAYAQTIDWTTTLVVPIPRNGATSKQMPVDGVMGNLIESKNYTPQYTLVWVKNGIIYAIGGIGTDASAAMAIANSLK